MTTSDDLGGDGLDLIGCLSRSEDHLGEPLAERPLVIHPSEAEVLKGPRVEERKQLICGLFWAHVAIANL